MVHRGNPGNGPAKGPGNGNPVKPFTKADGDNPGAGYLAARMRAWRERKQAEDPEYQPPERPLNSKEFQELAKAASPAALETLVKIHEDPKQLALARVRAAEILIERGHGKAVQTVQHKAAVTEQTDAELLAEFQAIAEEHGIVIDLAPEGYRDISGTEEAREFAEPAPLVRDVLEDSGPDAGASP